MLLVKAICKRFLKAILSDELLDYLQTNNTFRKSKFINYNFDDSTLLAPLSTIQQDVLDYLYEFIALQSVRDEYYKELSKPTLLP